MSMQEAGKVQPKTASVENVPVAQEISVRSSTHVRATCSSMEQHTSMHSIVGALDIVERLQGVVFLRPEGKHDSGVLVENLAEVVRGAIAYGEGGDDVKAVDYGCLMAVLFGAVNEQQTQLREQQRSLREQKAQVARLRVDLERLKTSIRAPIRYFLRPCLPPKKDKYHAPPHDDPRSREDLCVCVCPLHPHLTPPVTGRGSTRRLGSTFLPDDD